MSCVCITRGFHMFTQADLLIVNHGHSYIDYDCAMCFWESIFVIIVRYHWYAFVSDTVFDMSLNIHLLQ